MVYEIVLPCEFREAQCIHSDTSALRKSKQQHNSYVVGSRISHTMMEVPLGRYAVVGRFGLFVL